MGFIMTFDGAASAGANRNCGFFWQKLIRCAGCGGLAAGNRNCDFSCFCVCRFCVGPFFLASSFYVFFAFCTSSSFPLIHSADCFSRDCWSGRGMVGKGDAIPSATSGWAQA
jgi:hypothetical protein